MTMSPGQLAEAQDLQPLLDAVVAAGAPGVLARVETPAETLPLASGVADRNTGAPMTPELRFRVGSITKTFVATVALQLVGEGRMSLDDPVGRWLPWLPRLLPEAKAITVRQLLNHTSGLFNYTDDPAWLLAALTGKTFRPEELVLIAALHPLTFAPGTDWAYSNTGYIVAGLTVEKVTGQGLGHQLRRRLFERLGLAHTTHPTSAQMPDPYPRGYAFIDGLGYLDVTTTIHPSAYWAAGAIISDAADLATFYEALLGAKLLRPDLLEAMKRTAVNAGGDDTGYGLGLIRVTTPCGTVWGHTGGVGGYASLAFSSPDGTRSVVMMTNVFFYPSQVRGALLEAFAAAACRALEQAPPAVAATDELAGLLPFFDDWSALSDIIRQTHKATLNLNLPNLTQPQDS